MDLKAFPWMYVPMKNANWKANFTNIATVLLSDSTRSRQYIIELIVTSFIVLKLIAFTISSLWRSLHKHEQKDRTKTLSDTGYCFQNLKYFH